MSKKAEEFYEKRRKARGYYNYDEVRLSKYIAKEMEAYHKEQLKLCVVSKSLPIKRKPTFKAWLEPFKDGEFGQYLYKEVWHNETSMQHIYNDLE